MLCLCRFANLHTNSIECSRLCLVADQSVAGQKQKTKNRKQKIAHTKFTLSALTNETRLE